MELANIVIYIALFLSLYFEVFLLITFFEPRSAPSAKCDLALGALSKQMPSVAVIVPCWNEESTISNTLKSLLALDYPTNKLEIIVVDDGSTDSTFEVISEFTDAENLKIFKKENGGKHSAMNYALERTEAEIVGCLDADSFVEPDALRKLVQHFADPTVASVTPSIKVHNASGLIQVIQKAEYGISIFLRKVFVSLDALFITPGPFSFFRRSAIDHVGQWRNAHMTEDLEMGLRLQQAHLRIENEPGAIVYTTAPDTLAKLYKQRVRWTYGFLRNAYEYRHMFFNKEYGNLGLLVLPMAAISILVALYITAYALLHLITLIIEQIIRLSVVGFSLNMPGFEFFYINTAVLTLVAITVAVGTFAAMALGKNLARDKAFTPDALAYLALYGFMAPLWLTSATIKVMSGIGINWR